MTHPSDIAVHGCAHTLYVQFRDANACLWTGGGNWWEKNKQTKKQEKVSLIVWTKTQLFVKFTREVLLKAENITALHHHKQKGHIDLSNLPKSAEQKSSLPIQNKARYNKQLTD